MIDWSAITEWKTEDQEGKPRYLYKTASNATWTTAKTGDFTLPAAEAVQDGLGLRMFFAMSTSFFNELKAVADANGTDMTAMKEATKAVLKEHGFTTSKSIEEHGDFIYGAQGIEGSTEARKSQETYIDTIDRVIETVQENATKVREMTAWMQPGTVDLLVLPEMALSGYVFSSPASILPYLEQPRIGPTSLLARDLATRLRCHVVAGYPEAASTEPAASEEQGPTSAETQSAGPSGSRPRVGSLSAADAGPPSMKELDGEALGVGYNSAVLVAPSGEVLGNYRKTFLFETDKNWARPGDGFMHFDLPQPLGRVALGICMDMNPKEFLAPWDAFELANYCRDNQVDMLVVPMNWLDPPAEPPNVEPELDPSAPSRHNLNYWAARLTPLHDPTPGYSSVPATPKETKEVVFVSCNRVGTEEGSKFVGTSSVMTISSSPSRIELVECCNMSEERVMLATVS